MEIGSKGVVPMKDTVDVLKDAMELPPPDRARLVNQLLSSLDQPDPEIDQKWKEEIKSRVKAVEEGKIDSVPLQDVLATYQT